MSFAKALKFTALLLALLAVWGCTKGEEAASDGKVTIVFKHGKLFAGKTSMSRLIEKFEKQNPKIMVREEVLPASTDEQHQFYVINLEGRSADFDVLALDVIWGPEFSSAGWLKDISRLLPKDEREKFFNGPIEAVTYSGKAYAVPWFMDAGLLYYRKDVLERYGFSPPRTWKELIDIASHVIEKEKGMYGFVWQGKQYEGLVCNVLEYFWSSGGTVIKEGRAAIDSPQNIMALKFIRDMIHKNGVAPELVTTATEEETRLIFGSGKAVFMRNWPYAWNIYERDDSPVKGKVGISALPHFEGGKSASTLGGWHLGVNAHSKHPGEAEMFIEFMTSYDSQKEIAMGIGLKPTRKALYSDEALIKAQPFLTQLYDVFSAARPRPVTPIYMMISQAMQSEFSAALSMIKEPDRALRDANKSIEAALAMVK